MRTTCSLITRQQCKINTVIPLSDLTDRPIQDRGILSVLRRHVRRRPPGGQLAKSGRRDRLGERTMEMKNTRVESRTIAGPEGMSQRAENSTPATEQTIPMISEYHVNVERLWVSW